MKSCISNTFFKSDIRPKLYQKHILDICNKLYNPEVLQVVCEKKNISSNELDKYFIQNILNFTFENEFATNMDILSTLYPKIALKKSNILEVIPVDKNVHIEKPDNNVTFPFLGELYFTNKLAINLSNISIEKYLIDSNTYNPMSMYYTLLLETQSKQFFDRLQILEGTKWKPSFMHIVDLANSNLK